MCKKKKHVILTVALYILRQIKVKKEMYQEQTVAAVLHFTCFYLFRFPGLPCNQMDLNYCQFQVCAMCLVAVISDSETPQTVCSPPASSVHGDSPGKTIGVGCHVLLQENFPTQGLNARDQMQVSSIAGRFFII